MTQRANSLAWARNEAILTLILSLLAFALPWNMGRYNDWMDWHLALHNVAAITPRVVVFAVGAAEGSAIRELHDGLTNLILILVLPHVSGVGLATLAHYENLVAAIITGRKRAAAEQRTGAIQSRVSRA